MKDSRDSELDELLSPLRRQTPSPHEIDRWAKTAINEASRERPRRLAIPVRSLAQVAAGMAAGLLLGYVAGSTGQEKAENFELAATIVQVQAKSD